MGTVCFFYVYNKEDFLPPTSSTYSHLDQLFHTIDNENEAVLIVVADVARPHPAVLVKGLLVGSFVVAETLSWP